jgi:hypothetical protein
VGEDDELRARIEARINARRAQMDTSRAKPRGKGDGPDEAGASEDDTQHDGGLSPRRPWLTGTAPSVRAANERAASENAPDLPAGSAAALEPSRPWLESERDSSGGSPRPEVRKPPSSLALPVEAPAAEPLSRRERRQQRRADRQAEKLREQQERENAKLREVEQREAAKREAQEQRDAERARREAEKAARRGRAPDAPSPAQTIAVTPEPPTVPAPAAPPEQVRVPVPSVAPSAPQPPEPERQPDPKPRQEQEPLQPGPAAASAPAPEPVAEEPAVIAAERAPEPAFDRPAAVTTDAPEPLPASQYQAELDALRAQIAELAAELNSAPGLIRPEGQ